MKSLKSCENELIPPVVYSILLEAASRKNCRYLCLFWLHINMKDSLRLYKAMMKSICWNRVFVMFHVRRFLFLLLLLFTTTLESNLNYVSLQSLCFSQLDHSWNATIPWEKVLVPYTRAIRVIITHQVYYADAPLNLKIPNPWTLSGLKEECSCLVT